MKPRVAWVYQLTKEQLEQELAGRRESTTGTCVELKRRLVAYVRAHPDEFEDKPEDAADYREEADLSSIIEALESQLSQFRDARHSTPQPEVRSERHSTSQSDVTAADTGRVLDQMRKWNCHFDGRDLYAFLERMEELQRAYGFSDDQILRGFPELLRGEAQLWYRNFQHEFGTLEQLTDGLRNFYLSPGELRSLDQQISNRKQGSAERIRAFTTALLTLMRRRGGYAPERQLDEIYFNMRAEYRLRLSRSSVNSVTELMQQAEEYEENKRQYELEISAQEKLARSSYRPPPRGPPPRHTPIAAAYDRQTCCWRCKQPGHDRYQCRNPPKRFCSFCGAEGLFTRDCACTRPGNASRAGEPGGSDRPPAE